LMVCAIFSLKYYKGNAFLAKSLAPLQFFN